MKKQLLLLVMILLPMVAMAEVVEINGIYYNLNLEEKTAEVTQNPNGYSGAIVIQEEVEYEGITYKVESIGISAFEYCNVTSITMPNSIKYIRDQAFYNSGSITNIVMSNNLESIGYAAFCGLEKIEEINIPNSVKEIGEYAFCRCKSVESFNIPDGVKVIGTYTFYRCEQLYSIIIPSSVNTIAWSAFRECYQLQKIEIPKGVLSIGGYAFYLCKQLAKVSFPSSLTEIGNHAFASCDDLSEVISYIKTPFDIESTAFECYNKATLYIPKGTMELYENAKGWKRFANISELPAPSYSLIYILDGEEYKKYEVEEGSEITPEPAPTKEGYTFSGWSGIPETMPANDVTVTGTFTINKYKLTYLLDGEVYKSFEIEYGTKITPEAEPTKEGYTFSGWSEIPKTMPAQDVTVTGTFVKINNVGDLTSLLAYIMNRSGSVFNQLYDLNNDGELNIGDIILMVKQIHQSQANAPAIARSARRLTSQTELSEFTAAQFIVNVENGTKLASIQLKGRNKATHKLSYEPIGNGMYSVVVYSTTNQLLDADESGLVDVVCTDGSTSRKVTITNVLLSTPESECRWINSLPASVVTGISSPMTSDSYDVYRLDGQRVSKDVLSKGLYIINGKKTVVR